MLVLAKQAFFWGGRNYDSPTKACVADYLKAQFLHVVKKPANFASLTDNFTSLLSKLLKLSSWMQTRQNIKQLFGPEKLSGLSRSGPLVEKSMRPPTAWTSSECKWLSVDVGLVKFMFVVLEKTTPTVSSTKRAWFAGMCAESVTWNFDVSKCEYPLREVNNLTDWTYGFFRVRIFIGVGRSQSGGRW